MSAAQGTPEWLQERCGHVTASEFSSVMAKIKTGEAATRRSYRMRVVTERLTQQPVETYYNKAMEWGNAHQKDAMVAYEALSGTIVEEVGFIKHPTVAFVGASPDGLIGEDGGVEIKCPYSSVVHVETISNGMPPEHIAQIQGNLWVSDRQWWDFICFDPRMPEHLQLYIQRIERDEKYIEELVAEIGRFLAETDALYRRLMERREK